MIIGMVSVSFVVVSMRAGVAPRWIEKMRIETTDLLKWLGSPWGCRLVNWRVKTPRKITLWYVHNTHTHRSRRNKSQDKTNALGGPFQKSTPTPRPACRIDARSNESWIPQHCWSLPTKIISISFVWLLILNQSKETVSIVEPLEKTTREWCVLLFWMISSLYYQKREIEKLS